MSNAFCADLSCLLNCESWKSSRYFSIIACKCIGYFCLILNLFIKSNFLRLSYMLSLILFVDTVAAKFETGHWEEALGPVKQYGVDRKRRTLAKTNSDLPVDRLSCSRQSIRFRQSSCWKVMPSNFSFRSKNSEGITHGIIVTTKTSRSYPALFVPVGNIDGVTVSESNQCYGHALET